MSPEQFCYWLQGFAELSGDNPPTPEQWKSIREHIATVFKKVTPSVKVGEQKIAPPDLASIKKAFEEEERRKQNSHLWPYRPDDQPLFLKKPAELIC